MYLFILVLIRETLTQVFFDEGISFVMIPTEVIEDEYYSFLIHCEIGLKIIFYKDSECANDERNTAFKILTLDSFCNLIFSLCTSNLLVFFRFLAE